MKKKLFLLVTLVATVVGANAQGQTATLQQNGKMTPFYGPDALVKAYNTAALRGAIITLSAGVFDTVDSITKQITIIGNGCTDYGGTNKTSLSYKETNSARNVYASSLIINANDVKIEGIYFGYNVFIRNASNTLFRNCYFGAGLHGTHSSHKNTVIDQCYVNNLLALAQGENMCIKNSFVEFAHGGDDASIAYMKNNSASNPAYFCNCIIYHYVDIVNKESGNTVSITYPFGTFKNCVLGQRRYNYNYEPLAINDEHTRNNSWNNYWISTLKNETYNEYYNNVWFLYPYEVSYKTSSYIRDNWIVNDIITRQQEIEGLKTKEMVSNLTESQTIKENSTSTWNALFNDEEGVNWWEVLKSDIQFKGDDGTVVGPYGGTGFNITPSIPRIVESKIDSNTDADGKLNVKIKVEMSK